MGRTVVTQKDVNRQVQAARARREEGAVAAGGGGTSAPPTPDTYRDRLVKYLPAEIVAIYLGLMNLLKTAQPDQMPVLTAQWVVFGVIFVITIPWQRKVMKVDKWQQVAIGTTAFVVWAISLGDPFNKSWEAWYYPLYGSMALMLFTFLIPLFEAEAD